MNHGTIGAQRLVSQQIARPTFSEPGEAVRWLGAVQAQDYLGALWAVAVRTVGATEQTVEQALAERRIVRTWPMRGTIHFVAPADVRWMLELLAPRVVQRSQGRLRQLGLDATTLAASATVIAKALEGGKQLTRPALYGVLESAGIAAGEQRGLHILGQLAHERLICFGARNGKQPTFTLLDEWVPSAPSLPRDEALATLALRYFTSHGPATVQDFVWWAGLPVADAKAGLGAASAQLASTTLDGQTYYFAEQHAAADGGEPCAVLLPPFDELLVAYRDRSASLDPAYNNLIVPGGNGIFNPIVVIGGRVVGTWKRVLKSDRVVLTFSPFVPWSDPQALALPAAAERYSRFLGLPAVMV
ncbi:MAG: AlkZ family DNA glycosylase [Chloroflexales bacterium]|nr:AlkZ family DNA glycosylase [Chloroflexales bacterium]